MSLELLNENIALPNCFSCKLSGTCNPGKGGLNKFMVIGEFPSSKEIALQIHNDGFPGKVLLSTLQQAGINIEDVWFTNMIMCSTLDGKSPDKNSLLMCHNRLMSEIKYVNPKNVLLLGETACMGILGHKLAHSEGRRFEKDGIIYIPTYSPQLFYKNWNLYRDFSKAISKLNKPWIKRNPFHENYTVAVSEQDILNWLNKYKDRNPLVSIDIETFGKTPRNGILHSIGLAINREDVIIIPIKYFDRNAIQSLFTILICQGANFLAHNADFEYSWINRFYDVRLPFKHDTFLYSYTIDERGGDDGEFTFSSGTHKLKNIVCKEYDIEDWSIDLENVFTLPEDEVYSYLNKDVQANFLALDICNNQEINTSPYTNIMIPSIPFMSHISNKGCKINEGRLLEIKSYYEELIEAHEEKFCELTNTKIDRFKKTKKSKELSKMEVAKLFYGDLGFKDINKGSVDENSIARLKEMYPENEILNLYSEYKKDCKTLSTSINGILENLHGGRIYSQFMSTIAETGRLASRGGEQGINLQNVPVHGKGKIIKECFIPDGNNVFVNFDHKQLEFRIIAHVSGDPKLIEYVKSGRDIHAEVASMFFSKPLNEVTEEERFDAKNKIVFAQLYLQTIYALAKSFGISEKEAEKRMQPVNEILYGINSWIDKTIEFVGGRLDENTNQYVGANNYIETIFGRRRRFPLIYSGNRHRIYRQAVNACIQSPASDINLLGGIEIFNKLYPLVDPAWPIHDSNLVQIPRDRLDLIDECRNILENPPVKLLVPLKVDISIGDNWGKMEKYVI